MSEASASGTVVRWRQRRGPTGHWPRTGRPTPTPPPHGGTAPLRPGLRALASYWAMATCWALAGLCWLAGAAAAADVPYLSGRVVDEAEILRPDTRQGLTALLKAHEDRTTNQIAVLTVRTLGGESVEDFATRVFEAWKLGRAGKDNGVLVIVAPGDRRLRIEVGYGLEGRLTDVEAARIIRDRITPRFKANDYDGGVTAGAEAIVAQLEGRAAGADVAAAGGDGGGRKGFAALEGFEALEQDLPPWPMRILLGAFIFGIIGLFTFIGIVTPGFGWFLFFFLIPFWAMFPIIVFGVKGALICLVIYLIGFPIAKLAMRSTQWHAQAVKDLKSKGTATLGGMVITGGGRSGGGWSSGSSGGGFSGGGGSSGGGGASGSW